MKHPTFHFLFPTLYKSFQQQIKSQERKFFDSTELIHLIRSNETQSKLKSTKLNSINSVIFLCFNNCNYFGYFMVIVWFGILLYSQFQYFSQYFYNK